ncbi:hypothetical protein GQ457_07G011220 [Hibiscus cannabinus]
MKPFRRLERCVISSTSTACSSEMIKERVNNWGLGELLVKSLGGKKFLVEFPDEELYNLLEEYNWKSSPKWKNGLKHSD